MDTCSRRQVLGVISAVAVAAALKTPHAKAQSTSPGGTLGFKSAIELARMIREKTISSVELTRYFIGRIERFDGALNAVVVRDFERALAAAAAADQALARGDVAGLLHGLPMTIKEQFDVEGLATTWGIPARKGNIAAKDSDYAARLKAAAAHILGKNNVPAELADWQSDNEIYGRTNNPWNVERTPGGSSGGTAAALAAGLTALDAGGDIDGSIRVPASFCGVVGFRTSPGLVPQYPKTLAWDSISVTGPMARTVGDVALMLSSIAGPDDRAPLSYDVDTSAFLDAVKRPSIKGWRVAWTPDLDGLIPVDAEVADVAERATRVFRSLGARVESGSPDFSVRVAFSTSLSVLVSPASKPARCVPPLGVAMMLT